MYVSMSIGAYPIDDDPDIFRMVLGSVLDEESFKKQYKQLDAATRDCLSARLDYYQVNIDVVIDYRAHSSLAVEDTVTSIKVTKTSASDKFKGFVWDPAILKYTVLIDAAQQMNIFVGFAPSKRFDVAKDNYTSCGWYLHLFSGLLYSQDGDRYKPYTTECKVGETIMCIYNNASGKISFEKNGVSLGVAFTDVKGEDIAPAVELWYRGTSVILSSYL
jgi:SPRY domain